MSNRSSMPDAEREKWALRRRDFLVLGSAAAFGAAASSVTASTLRAVAAPEFGAVLSIGYSERTAPVVVDADATTTIPVTAAKALRVSDGGFRDSGARVLVHGFSAPAGSPAVSVRLSTFAPTADGPVPFLAWTHRADRQGRTFTSPRVSFAAALDDDGTLPFAIERHESASRWSRLFAQPANEVALALPELAKLEQGGNVCRLTSGDRGDARLRAGTYFIALRRTSSDRQPDWSSIVVDATAADASTALRRHGRPVDFEYVALTVTEPIA